MKHCPLGVMEYNWHTDYLFLERPKQWNLQSKKLLVLSLCPSGIYTHIGILFEIAYGMLMQKKQEGYYVNQFHKRSN